MTESPRNIHDIHADLNWLNTYGTLALFNSLLAITNYASDIKSCLLSHQNINSTHICACINAHDAGSIVVLPSEIHVIVTGGPGIKMTVMPLWGGGTRTVTRQLVAA